MTDSFDRKAFVAGYLIEAEEHLRLTNRNLLAAEAALGKKEPQDRLVRELFRSLHTLKGLSAMVGVEPVVELAHEMENILRTAERTTGQLSNAGVDLLLSGVRAIELRVAAFAADEPVPEPPLELIQALASVQCATGDSPEVALPRILMEPELLSKLSPVEQMQLAQAVAHGQRALLIEYAPSPARMAEGVSIGTVRERVGALAEIVKVLPRSVPKSERAPGGLIFTLVALSSASDTQLGEAAFANPGQRSVLEIPIEANTGVEPLAARGATAIETVVDDEELDDAPFRTASIRVDVQRLDAAMENLSTLVVTRFRLARAVAKLRDQGVNVRELSAIVDENRRQLRDLRACIMRARMVPVRELLERVPLIVRSMSRSTGKTIELKIETGSTELDKAVGERIFPAVVHLVRNAIDHAIESPMARRHLGKPEAGCVTVSCHEHSNSELELRVSDDGRGVDAKQIASKAGRPEPRNNEELLELITLPGLSTVDRATQRSGRGMGMEIVKRITQDMLGGTLSLQTTPQVGTSFTLRIPLTLSILDGLVFTCGDQTFVVPMAMVEEIIEVVPARVYGVPTPKGQRAPLRMVDRRGEGLVLLQLAGLLSIEGAAEHPEKALLVRRHHELFAFGVDRLLGQQEVVIRPLEDPLVRTSGVTGATDLGDGKPTLVLDLLGLLDLVSRKSERMTG